MRDVHLKIENIEEQQQKENKCQICQLNFPTNSVNFSKIYKLF